MTLPKDRWTVVTPSDFPWEQEALDYFRQYAPEATVLHVWSNFEFSNQYGAIYEGDMLVLTTWGVYLVEIKNWAGPIEGDAFTWRVGSRFEDNPLVLLNKKARIVGGMLRTQLDRARQIQAPRVESLLFLSHPDIKFKLDGDIASRVFTRHTLQAGFSTTQERRFDRRTEVLLIKGIREMGIRPPVRASRVGDYQFGELLADGPTWQDFKATHVSLPQVVRRVRQFSVAQAASQADREAARRAAHRDFMFMEGVQHPGILKPLSLHENDYGPAIVYEHDPDAVRLDKWVAARGHRLDERQRLAILRQLADALRYAHSRRLLHRALSPQSVLVYGSDTPTPHIKIMNWYTGMRLESTTGTEHIDRLVEEASAVYIAPEALLTPTRATEASDVFSLGATAFFLFTGRPPARSVLELQDILATHNGLRTSSIIDGVNPYVEDIIHDATQPDATLRDPLEDFIGNLDLAETPDCGEQFVPDPINAQKNSRLTKDITVRKELGTGSVSKAFLVDRGDEELVLKVALNPANNARLRDEARILMKLHGRATIVECIDELELAGRACLLLRRAGDKTLDERLREEGRLQSDLLERYGLDLLTAVLELEQAGIAHRDIKPANLGVARVGYQEELHLVLFDFSLSTEPVENIVAGTQRYLDPFLKLRRPPRWDVQAERYAAAVTMYEMATGVLPRWGDGLSDPALVECDLQLDTDFLEPNLRDSLAAFFEKALHRDVQARFDNAEEMRTTWVAVFDEARRRARDAQRPPQPDRVDPMTEAEPGTSVFALGLPHPAEQLLDRLQVLTVQDFLQLPSRDIHLMKGVGNQVRRQLTTLQEKLRQRFPEAALTPLQPDRPDSPVRTLEPLSQALLGRKPTAPGGVSAWLVKASFLGLGEDAWAEGPWPTHAELAAGTGMPLSDVRTTLDRLRQDWRKDDSLVGVRKTIRLLLQANGGVMTPNELAEGVRAEQGALSDNEVGIMRLAHAVMRAAVEAEQAEATPAFIVRREGDRLLVALSRELAEYALALGAEADRLASEERVVSPTRALERLRAVPPPEDAAISNPRLYRLAALASQQAALSGRQEFYPRGLDARRVLRLSYGALVDMPRVEGTDRRGLTLPQLQDRVQSRYPDAAPLPGRPELDKLLKDEGLEMEWDPALEVYARIETVRKSSSVSTPHRFPTSGVLPPGSISPEVADARQLEEKLYYARRDGGFLVLMVEPKFMRRAELDLAARFDLQRRSVEALLLEAMQAEAQRARVDWELVLRADTQPGTSHWNNLFRLVRQAVPRLLETLQQDSSLLLVHPGLLARYNAMDVLEALRDSTTRHDGLHSVWLLVPQEEQDLPLVDGVAVPIISPGQRARLTRAWLENQHRGRRDASPTPLSTNTSATALA